MNSNTFLELNFLTPMNTDVSVRLDQLHKKEESYMLERYNGSKSGTMRSFYCTIRMMFIQFRTK